MPIRARAAAISRSRMRSRRPVSASIRYPMGSPSMAIVPLSYSSSRLMQRSSVVLPEPLGPITTTTSPGVTASDTSRNTSTAPKRLRSAVISRIGRCCRAGRSSVAEEDASFKVPAIEGEGITDAEIDRGRTDKDLKRREGALDDLAACHRQLPEADDRDQRGCLDQADAQADIGRCGEPQRLRQDHDLQHQTTRHAETARRIPLRLRQRKDAGSEDLADKGGVVERDDQHHAPEWRQVDAGQRQQVVDESQQHQERDAAYQEQIAEDR